MFPGTTINLGGTEFILPGMSLRWMYSNDDILKALREPQNVSVLEYTRFAVPLLHHALQRNYPDLTRERLEELIDAATCVDLVALVFINSGFVPLAPKVPGAAQTGAENEGANSPDKKSSESSSTEPDGSQTKSSTD